MRERRGESRRQPKVAPPERQEPGALDGLLAEIAAEQRRGLPWVFDRVAAVKARRPKLQRLRRRWATQDRKRDQDEQS